MKIGIEYVKKHEKDSGALSPIDGYHQFKFSFRILSSALVKLLSLNKGGGKSSRQIPAPCPQSVLFIFLQAKRLP